MQKIFDYRYGSDAECAARAVGQLRKHLATARHGQVATLPNVGLQLFDVVTVTDARCGIWNGTYRVRGIEEVYDTMKPPLVLTQTVTLGVGDHVLDCVRLIHMDSVDHPGRAAILALASLPCVCYN